MKAVLVTIGDELLNGQTIDTNSAWLGQQLNNIGINIEAKLSVGDSKEAILNGLEYAYSIASLVIVTGGLGPTKDDITKKVLADYFKDQLIFDPIVYERIAIYFRKTGRHPTEAHRLQCYMPSKAAMIENDRGTAPGMWFAEGNKILLSMPGVPSEMKGIMVDHALKRIEALNSGLHIQHYIIQTAGLGETFIEEKINDIVCCFPEELNLAFLPGLGSVKLRITAKGPDLVYLNEQLEKYGIEIVNRLGSAVVGTGNLKLEEAVGILAKEKGVSIATAESCTGGHIAQLITSVSGSSDYFKGSIVAYANEVKMNLLQVNPLTLAEHGAVSEQTVREMVSGVVEKLKVDVGVAVSGIAGPGGGTPEKPVGTIWIAVGDKKHIITRKLQLVKTRELNIRYTGVAALNHLRLFLQDLL